jgi:hypothetical protein
LPLDDHLICFSSGSGSVVARKRFDNSLDRGRKRVCLGSSDVQLAVEQARGQFWIGILYRG